MSQIKRRDFIGLAATGAAGLALPTLTQAEPALMELARPRLLEILGESGVVRELGARYLELMPAESSVDALTREITNAIPGVQHSALRRSQVDEQIRRDFVAGDTVTLAGWVLSVTEARQCALFALVAT